MHAYSTNHLITYLASERSSGKSQRIHLASPPPSKISSPVQSVYCTVLYCAVLIQAGEAGDGVTLDPAPVGAQNVVEELVLLLIIRHQ